MNELTPQEKTDDEKIIEEQRLTRMQIAQMIMLQHKMINEIRKWGIVITVLLAIPIAILLFFLIRPMFGP